MPCFRSLPTSSTKMIFLMLWCQSVGATHRVTPKAANRCEYDLGYSDDIFESLLMATGTRGHQSELDVCFIRDCLTSLKVPIKICI